jgi:Na+/H+ antiporter NhaD/arsenite permease-like protein
MPLIYPTFWHRFEFPALFGIAGISVILTFSLIHNAFPIFKHVLIEDYVPFIIMLFTLYTLSHGIHINIKAKPSTINNVIFLGICSFFASVIGTTGASMLFLRPFIAMNNSRKNKAHLIIFFIFLVANIGGLLSPLGDPPLLLGYLHGVDFFWCAQNLSGVWTFYVISCLGILYFIDRFIMKKEEDRHLAEARSIHEQFEGATMAKNHNISNISNNQPNDSSYGTTSKLFEDEGFCKRAIVHTNEQFSIKITGFLNIFLVILTVFVLFFDFNMIFKNILLLVFCGISLRNHKGPKIDFAPFKEVALTFFVIFVVIAPVVFMLTQLSDEISKHMSGATSYFWSCGIASSFLDNAPSYFLLFNMAGGKANELMFGYPDILRAISISSVVMGAMTYIGNAPNMMVRSFAIKHGFKMPSFLGYMLWSFAIILPLSLIVSMLFL